MSTKGPLIILSGPSGSGKSTVIRRLLAGGGPPLRLSVSATTRPPRPGEREGVDYYFWTDEQFQQHRAAGEFLECAQVHGHWYGTLRREVDGYRARGVGVLLDIDVQGAVQIRRQYPESLSIFLRTSSWETYEERLRQRGTEDEAGIRRRLQTAREELKHEKEFDWVVPNDDLEAAVALVGSLVLWAFGKGANVLDELKEEWIVQKVGGRFKLSTLIQKRMVALNTGARPLVEVPPQQRGDKMAIVIQEILQDKIYLDASNQVQARGLSANDAVRRAMLGDISADLGGGGDD
jgi:guanylate kinase